jgi:hypothetical protein
VLTLGNINFASAFMAMTCIATATRILHLQSKGIIGSKFLFQILSFGTQSFVLYLTDSTQGLVVILVGLVFLSIFSFYDQLLNHGFAPKFLLFMGVTITGATITLGIRGFGPLAPLLSSGLRSIEDRFYHWISAIRMFREFPYSGVGIDSFGDWYPKFRTEEAIQLRGSVETYTNNAHSVPFQLAATGGLLLLIPYLALVLLVCFRGIRLLRNLPSDPIVAGVVSIWVVYQLQSLVSIDQVGLAVWGWVSAGVILSVDQNFQRTQVSSRSPDKKIESKKLSDLQSAKMGNNLAKSFRAPLILVVYLWLAIAIVFPSMINEARINKEVNFVRYASSITKDGVDKSAISDSINRLFELGEESTSPTLRVFLIQELTKYGYISRLQEFAENTTQQFPRNVNAWNSLAQIYEQTGQLELAVAARERQLSLDPLNNLVLKKLSENRQALNPNE